MDKATPSKQPFISVVMCSYNARHYIEQAINCVINQTYKDWELIICDDCSTDGTREWLTQLNDPRIRIYLHENNLGYVANKNFGHQQAKGNYITQLDNDDLMRHDKLEKQVNIIKLKPEIKIIGTGYERINDNGEVLSTSLLEGDRIFENPVRSYPFWFPNLLVAKEVFDKIGYFNEYFAGVYGDDIYWTVKANKYFPIYFLNSPLYSYRSNYGSITNVLNNNKKLIFGYLIKHLIEQRLTTGTDWLEQGEMAQLKKKEQELLTNKPVLAEQYRVWAAKAIDNQDFKQAYKLITKAITADKFQVKHLNTIFYFLRKLVKKENSD